MWLVIKVESYHSILDHMLDDKTTNRIALIPVSGIFVEFGLLQSFLSVNKSSVNIINLGNSSVLLHLGKPPLFMLR